MIAVFPVHTLSELLNILQEKFNTSVLLSIFQYNLIEHKAPAKSALREWATLKLWDKPHKEDNSKKHTLKLLSLKAKALALELEF